MYVPTTSNVNCRGAQWSSACSHNRTIFPHEMLFVVLLLCAVLGLSAPSSFGFSNVFGDHMVLQRGRVNPVWGFTSPGGSVSVEYSGGSPLSATARADGFWSVSLPSMKESFTPITITAADSAAGWKASLVDVLIGDVFFCSGQSNMQFPMNMINNATAEVQAANNYPGIRISRCSSPCADAVAVPALSP